MISCLQGVISSNQNGQVILMTAGGVGYTIFGSLAGLKMWQIGTSETISTYLVVRENALELYGFVNDVERVLFLRLIQVSGVGPKTALHILSLGTTTEINSAIARGDFNYLTKVSGVGKKIAERIVVELKDKITLNWEASSEDNNVGVLGDVVEGLVALGYALNEARTAVKNIVITNKTAEEILREALRNIR